MPPSSTPCCLKQQTLDLRGRTESPGSISSTSKPRLDDLPAAGMPSCAHLSPLKEPRWQALLQHGSALCVTAAQLLHGPPAWQLLAGGCEGAAGLHQASSGAVLKASRGDSPTP